MKVLMFGWEFPPHISGGLGTACYGLTKGLSSLSNIDILFVVPKLHGDEDQDVAKLIGANNTKIQYKRVVPQEVWRERSYKVYEREEVPFTHERMEEEMRINEFTYIEVESKLIPYLGPEEFIKVIKERYPEYIQKKHLEEGKYFITKEKVITERYLEQTENVEVESEFSYNFSGKYGVNLMEEVSTYAYIAYEIAKQHDFDIIHAHDWLTYHAGIAAKQASGKPLVIHVHATEFDRSGYHVNQQVYDIERAGMDFADRIITVSNLTRDTVIQRYGQSPEKVITVYNAVEPVEYTEDHSYKKTVDEKLVTFLGRITFQKGPEYFVEAAFRVLQRMKNVRFVMAGSGDLMNKMIRRAAKLGISDHFHFAGFLKGQDVERMFAMSDVYVMPSVSEPFGISPLEAMRSNVPVIISKQSGVSEILTHAIKVDFWDIDAIADAIYGLLNYEALPEIFRKYGKNEVDTLKWDNAAARIKEVYESVLNGGVPQRETFYE